MNTNMQHPKATVPQLISPVVTFAVYIAVARGDKGGGATLTATNMFTTLSLLLLIGEPLFSLFEGMISIMTAIGCLRRVEEFLHTTVRTEKRVFLRNPDHSATSHIETSTNGDIGTTVDLSTDVPNDCGIMIRNGSFGWDTESEQPLLKDISLTVPTGQITAVISPVGCGKSTLIKAILGETTVWDGSMVLSGPDVAFCDQSPWIMVSYLSFFPFSSDNYILRNTYQMAYERRSLERHDPRQHHLRIGL